AITHGTLTSFATSISVWVGYLGPGSDTDSIQLRALDTDGNPIAQTPFEPVVQSAPFVQLSVTAPGANIAAFELEASGPGRKAEAMDDLAITYPDVPSPPDFSIAAGQSVADVLTGESVDVPVGINRLNGSNGDVAFAASGLPTGMHASFAPNPVGGTSTHTVLTLSADAGAATSDQYTEVTVTGTPGAGAGSSPRSVKKLVRIRENCTRTLAFTYVDARSEGCMQKHGNDYSATDTSVRVDGLVIKPADDSRPTLVINPHDKTIKGQSITMPFKVAIDSSPDIPIYAGPIDWDFKEGGPGPHKIVGFKLDNGKKLGALPITQLDASFLQSAKTQFTVSLKLDFWPFNYVGAITSDTKLTTDNDHGADLTGLEIKVAKIDVVALELKNVDLKWQQGSGGGTWAGSATAVLKFAHNFSITAGFGIKNGSFDFLKGGIGGLNVSVGPGIFLQAIGFEVHRNPLQLVGTVGLTGGPSVAGASAVAIDGALKAVLDDPFVVEVDGNVKVADHFNIGSAFVRYSSTGLFEFGGNADFTLWLLSAHGALDGWVDGFQAFNVQGSLEACLDVWGPDPCGEAKAVLSSKGVAGCVGVFGEHVGAGATWDFDFDAFTGCDLTRYSEVHPKLHAAGQPTTFSIPKGLPSVAWELKGDGGPPGVTVTGPNGEAVSVSQEVPTVKTDHIFAQLRMDGTTFVLVDKPSAGLWSVSDDDTFRVTRIREARGLPQPRAKVRVTGTGRKRVLHWRLRAIAHQSVTFAEIGKDVRNAIVTTSKPRGSVRFRPADGPAGRRKIQALVQQGGVPRTTLTAGSYRAPGMPKPGRPRKLNIRRTGTKLIVSWRPHPRGFRSAVHVKLTNGRQLVRVVAPKQHRLKLKGVGRKVGATVRVMGLTDGNSKGPAAQRKIGKRRRRA
ncbi:MAG: hypothetical protein QOG63_2578, partial [Thermoleophilaceae bacterium]|nr:hypothetical protein [Thermoleophilaceae bacterium]